jgi:hypothetical protein
MVGHRGHRPFRPLAAPEASSEGTKGWREPALWSSRMAAERHGLALGELEEEEEEDEEIDENRLF